MAVTNFTKLKCVKVPTLETSKTKPNTVTEENTKTRKIPNYRPLYIKNDDHKENDFFINADTVPINTVVEKPNLSDYHCGKCDW